MEPVRVLAWMLLSGLPAGATEVWGVDFAAQSGELVVGGDLGTVWEWGPVGSGPGSGFSGPTAWATNLTGPHLNDIEEWVELPVVPAAGLSSPVVGLLHWHDLDASGAGDLARVEQFVDGAWSTLEPLYGYPVPGGFQGESGGWLRTWFAVEPEESRLRLVVEADTAVARDGWYVGGIALHDGDPVPPAVAVTVAPTDTQELAGGYPVEVRAIDNVGVVSGSVSWSAGTNSGTTPLAFAGDFGQATLPVIEPGTTMTWSAAVTDGTNVSATTPRSFRVFLAAPGGLRGPGRPVAGSSASLNWTPAESPHPVLESVLFRDGVVVLRTQGRRARVPLLEGTQSWTVASVFDTPLGQRRGEASAPFDITALLPGFGGLWPTSGWPGDRLRLEVEGDNLLFADGDVEFDLGDGITVQGLEVRDVDTLVAEIEVAAEALPGPRALSLRSGRRDLVVEGAFDVEDTAARPRLLSARPSFVERGEQVRVLLTLTEAPATDEPTVYLGPGVVVETLMVRGSEVEVMATVPLDSPTGTTAVEVDDGERIWTGATFEVRRQAPAVASTCSSLVLPARGGWWLLFVGAGAFGRARRRSRPGKRVQDGASSRGAPA